MNHFIIDLKIVQESENLKSQILAFECQIFNVVSDLWTPLNMPQDCEKQTLSHIDINQCSPLTNTESWRWFIKIIWTFKCHTNALSKANQIRQLQTLALLIALLTPLTTAYSQFIHLPFRLNTQGETPSTANQTLKVQ